jgi:hypothetical protein
MPTGKTLSLTARKPDNREINRVVFDFRARNPRFLPKFRNFPFGTGINREFANPDPSHSKRGCYEQTQDRAQFIREFNREFAR